MSYALCSAGSADFDGHDYAQLKVSHLLQITQQEFLAELEKISSGELHPVLQEALAKIAAANPFKGGQGVFQSFGKSLMEGGKMLASPKLVGVGQFAQAGTGNRLAGEVAHSVGHHYAHKGLLGNLINPLGGALGGAAEGLTRFGGQELASRGATLGGKAGQSMARAGGLMQKHAPKVGVGGEIAGLAGLGTAVHAPLSLAGAVGGKVLGGGVGALSAAVPAAGEAAAHALHGVGPMAEHGLADVVGGKVQGLAGKAKDMAGRLIGKTPIPEGT